MRAGVLVFLLAAVLAAGDAVADRGQCLRTLSDLGTRFRTTKKRGVSIGVHVIDDVLGGVRYEGYKKKPLVLDCSLAVSLARSGLYLRSLGVEKVTYSSAYQRRNIRGTRRLSRHSFGLAIDIHTFKGETIGTLRVKDDYEQGLGDYDDCVGAPLTDGGKVLRSLDCSFSESGWYRIVLSPDYDAAHYNHLHIEARPWNERTMQGRLGPVR